MPLRILHLLTSAGLGGTESSVLVLARGMDPDRFWSEVAVLRGEGPMSARWRQAGLAVTHLNVQREWTPRAVQKLARLVRGGRYDVVTLYGVAVNVLGRLACKLAGQRSVVGVIRGLTNERTISRTRLWLDRLSFPWAVCYVSNSQAVIDHLVEAGFPAGKLRLARTGLSTDPFDRAPPREEARRQVGIGRVPPPVVTCVGNLRPVKNHSFLLRACRLLVDRQVGFLLLLVGAGLEEGRLRRQVRDLSLTEHVRFLGGREDVPVVLAASDLFVLSSLWEGLPRSVMEAMAGRLAVVATDAGGVKELVVDGETGYVLPVSDAAAFAGRMAELLENPALRRRMGEAGYRRVQERFTEDRMVRAMEKIYLEVLGHSGRSGRHPHGAENPARS